MLELSPLINRDKCLAPLPLRSGTAHTEPFDLDALIKLIEPSNTEKQNKLKTQFEKHLAPSYTYHQQLKDMLATITLSLKNNAAKNKSHQTAIITRLLDDIDNCTPGFLIRVQSILISLNLPQSLDELLAQFRMTIVEQVAGAYVSNVHSNRQFYTVADAMGFGIHGFDIEDSYGLPILNDICTEILKIFIPKYFTPAHILAEAWLHPFTTMGYKGPETNMTFGLYNTLLDYIKKILGKADLTYQDVFVISNNNVISDIDWLKFYELQLKHFQDTGYFNKQKLSPNSALVDIIESTNDIKNLLEHLSEEQFGAVCEALKNKLEHFITSSKEFSNFLRDLTPERCKLVCYSLKHKLSDIIISSWDFVRVIEYLRSEKCKAVCNALIDILSDIIQSSEDFSNSLKLLSPKQRTAVYESFKDRLDSIIKTNQDLGLVLKYLSPEQGAEIFEMLLDKQPDIFKSSVDVRHTLIHLTHKQRISFMSFLDNRKYEITHSAEDFDNIISALPITLEEIRHFVERAQNNYSQWYADEHSRFFIGADNKLRFNLLHHHGLTGQVRAKNLLGRVATSHNKEEAIDAIKLHINRTSLLGLKAAHRHKHSFHTYLINELWRQQLPPKSSNLFAYNNTISSCLVWPKITANTLEHDETEDMTPNELTTNAMKHV